ncbi:MAG: YceH family protein [Gammaproteobacteria bacterium]|nr:YceH family protein [Gammaproteobacteria bacterium]
MLLKLTANEARVIGCLMEKSVVTPDQYPMTLNALTNACNQKSSRDPVMSLDQGTVQATAHDLRDKHLVRVEENFKTGKEKYRQRFCNTQLADYQFDSAQFAIVCLLLLRGPQTPGELRARSGRLHAFADNAAVEVVLTALVEWHGNPLVVKLPRTPGRRDAEYMHLFSGPVDIAARPAAAKATTDRGNPKAASTTELEQRVSRLEAEVAALKQRFSGSEQ